MPAMVWEMMLWWVQGCLWLLSAAGDAPACRACCRRLSVYGMQDQGVLSIPRLLKPWQHHCGAATALSDAASTLWHALQANNCAKILDNLLRQDLGINAGSCFNHAVRAANGVLPQASGWTVAMPSNQTAMLNTNSCLICFAQLFRVNCPQHHLPGIPTSLQSVVQGIDYVRQQRNDVMHTLGVFCLQAS